MYIYVFSSLNISFSSLFLIFTSARVSLAALDPFTTTPHVPSPSLMIGCNCKYSSPFIVLVIVLFTSFSIYHLSPPLSLSFPLSFPSRLIIALIIDSYIYQSIFRLHRSPLHRSLASFPLLRPSCVPHHTSPGPHYRLIILNNVCVNCYFLSLIVFFRFITIVVVIRYLTSPFLLFFHRVFFSLGIWIPLSSL